MQNQEQSFKENRMAQKPAKNPIAKNAHKVNKALVFVDRKKKSLKLACRHRKGSRNNLEPFCLPRI